MDSKLKVFSDKLTRPVLATLSAILFVISLLSLIFLYNVQKREKDVRYVGIMNVVTEKLSKTISGVELNANNVFDEVRKHLDSPETVIAALKNKTSLNLDVIGYFAAFVPNYFPQEGRWFQPYVHQGDSTEFVLTLVGSARHDYTTSSTWYVQGVKEKDSFWSQPYYYEDDLNVASGYYITFATPIFDKDGRLACICGADMTQDWLTGKLRKIENEVKHDELLNRYTTLGGSDFYIVILNNSDGSCFVHPDGDVVTLDGEVLADDLKQQKRGIAEMDVNRVPSKVYYAPLIHTNWSVAVVVPE